MLMVKMLRNPSSSFQCNLLEGQTGEVPDELGETLVSLNIAELISKKVEAPKKIKGVAKAPEVAKKVEPTIAKVDE